MNDEIKEMLELHIKNDIDLLPKNQKIVLDYIINLQQELEEYKDTETYSKRFLYKANKDRLNANLDLVKELEDYKSRCEKAVEFIKENDFTNDKNFMDTGIGNLFKVILKFLEGRSDE